MPDRKTVFTSQDVEGLLRRMAEAIANKHENLTDLALIGIRTGGAHLAFRLRDMLKKIAGTSPKTGVIDITLYRDDWTRLHSRPLVGKTEIDFPLEDRVVVLVDDVLYTGRTVRAALDAVIDFGRPSRIELAALVDRGHRELPLQPDYVGAKVETTAQEVIDVFLKEETGGEDSVVKRRRQG